MKRKPLFYTLTGIVTIIAFFVFVSTLVAALRPAPEKEVAVGGMNILQPTIQNIVETIPADEVTPVTLSVPSLGISTKVQQVGINTKGNISSPSSFSQVAWYKYGPKPGGNGVAIIDGHLNNGLGVSGVFEHLDTIKVGDSIYVSDAQGKQISFIVKEVRMIDYTEKTLDFLYKKTGNPQLALITCSGAWVKNEKTYDKRIVVLADLSAMR